MIWLMNYANCVYRGSQKRNNRSGMDTGRFDRIISFSPGDIDPDFRKKNDHIFRQRRGDGFYLWKPYFIHKVLQQINNGDYLFYSDAAAYFITPICELVNCCEKSAQDIIPFDLTAPEKFWTKRDAFKLLDCDSPKFYETNQRMASFSLWRKTAFSTGFSETYLEYSQDERILADWVNQTDLPNYDGFVAHRHDQSIFSLLTKKYDLDPFRDPSQFGNGQVDDYPNSNYGQIIVHTRKKNRLLLLLFLMSSLKSWDDLCDIVSYLDIKHFFRKRK
ncbi:MAG: hypothetical protein JXA42_17530 [Anaerolineales bacterium]|nr:hypothetical protein [Anaerolineales bacterium]